MSTITLENTALETTTVLSNIFIDCYMPEANGEFVKVYIYLLRILRNTPASFSLEQMADKLFCNERDITRALKYWKDVGLLLIEYNDSQEISRILLQTPKIKNEQTSPIALISEIPENIPQSSVEKLHVPTAEAPVSAPQTETADKTLQSPVPKTETAEVQMELSGTQVPSVSTVKASVPDRKYTLTPSRVGELKEKEEVIQLLYIAEQYLNKTLTGTEIHTLLYFYDEFKFSVDLIEHLIDYCVSNNHKSIRYIEKVAHSWAENGIVNVTMAKAYTLQYSERYFTIFKFLGINKRMPIQSEITFMDTWLDEYHFSFALIEEACKRTILQIGQPNFRYVDKILTDWKNHNVHNTEDIKQLDDKHKKKNAKKSPAPKMTVPANRFNNFQQREYNFEEYEKLLLNQ